LQQNNIAEKNERDLLWLDVTLTCHCDLSIGQSVPPAAAGVESKSMKTRSNLMKRDFSFLLDTIQQLRRVVLLDESQAVLGTMRKMGNQ